MERAGAKTSSCILIVEDHDDSRAMLAEHFKFVGYRVVTANDGNGAVAVALASHPDAVVLDPMLPNLDGIEVASLLRSYVPTRSVPIVIWTARGNATDLQRARDLRCEVLFKPCTPQEVADVLWTMLRGARPAHV